MSENQDQIQNQPDNGYHYLGDFSSQSAFDRAEREDLRVVLPKDNELFVDIDNDSAFAVFETNYDRLLHFYAATIVSVSPSKSGGERKHITIELDEPIDPTERLVLQAFLGSDIRREFLGLQRIRVKDPNPTLFLEKKS